MSGIIIACGGTGGHLSPGIALAERLREHKQESLLIVSRKKIDEKLLEKYPDLKFQCAPGTPFSLRPVPFLRFVKSQVSAVLFAAKLVRKNRPVAFVSFGGFMTLGMALVCRVCGLPVVLHEANRIPGKAVRTLSKIATRVWLPHGVILKNLSRKKMRHTGFPLRKEMAPLSKIAARRALNFPEDGKLLLVLGGSQGATSLNNWARENFEKIAGAGAHLLCVTGPGKLDFPPQNDTAAPKKNHVAKFIPFCAQMPEALSAADLVVSRAGAGSIAEIAACGVPAVLVPFPFSADGHQDENARNFERNGGGVIVWQSEISELTGVVCAILSDEKRRCHYRENLEKIHRQNDWQSMVDDLLALAGAIPAEKTEDGK